MKGLSNSTFKSPGRAFQVNASLQKREVCCKQRIARRLRRRNWPAQSEPMFRGRNLHYEGGDRVRGLGSGGIGAMHLLAQRTGLTTEIDASLQLLQVHQPYHESDHVLNIAYNILCGGRTLEDLEQLRHDEVYQDAIGARVVPDPTTAGDFTRRFQEADVEALMGAIDRVRVKVWQQQPAAFFAEAIVEADGTLAPTTGERKEGMDISYNGVWGYHPLVVTLANTGEPLYLVNRGGNRPSHEGAAQRFDQAIALCRQAGFREVLLRGDTDFSSTQHLDRWDAAGVRFVLGIDAMPNLVAMAADPAQCTWQWLQRPAKYAVKTKERDRRENIKERVVREREFQNIRLQSEDVAEFRYQPGACRRSYRVVVVRKNLSVAKGEHVLFDDLRYFFYITNDDATPADELVLLANDRCNQENLIDQLKNGVHALRMPVSTRVSNGAYMVMASLAWTLKAWFALLLPETGRWKAQYTAEKQKVLRMEFRTFQRAFIAMPCQIVRAGRRIVYRLLAWNPWQRVFLRGVEALRSPLRC